MKKDMKDDMAHYLKSFTREKAIGVFVVAICLSAIIGAFCGSLLTQKERTKAELNIAKAEETLKSVITTRDDLKREYSSLTASTTTKQSDQTETTHAQSRTSLMDEFRDYGFLKRVDREIKRVYVDEVMWATTNIDEKERITKFFAGSFGGYVDVYGYNSGKILAKYGLLGFKVYP